MDGGLGEGVESRLLGGGRGDGSAGVVFGICIGGMDDGMIASLDCMNVTVDVAVGIFPLSFGREDAVHLSGLLPAFVPDETWIVTACQPDTSRRQPHIHIPSHPAMPHSSPSHIPQPSPVAAAHRAGTSREPASRPEHGIKKTSPRLRSRDDGA